MKDFLKKFKEGLYIGTGILVALSIGAFAYQFTTYEDIEDVGVGQTLTKDTFNQLLANIRKHDSDIIDLKQREFTFSGLVVQNAFDTNEVWTGKYDVSDSSSPKKVYSRWVYFGAGPNNTRKYVNHNIPKIVKIIDYEFLLLYNDNGLVLMKDRKDISNEVNNTRMAVSSTDNKSSSNIWFRIEYTCENDLCQ